MSIESSSAAWRKEVAPEKTILNEFNSAVWTANSEGERGGTECKEDSGDLHGSFMAGIEARLMSCLD